MPEADTNLTEVLESMDPIIFYTDRPSPELVMEMHEEHQGNKEPLEIAEPAEFEIVVQDLPGVDQLDPEREPTLEVRDDTVESNETQHVKEEKPTGIWDWQHVIDKDGPHGFMGWIKERIDSVPKHSGYDKAGLLRAVGYLEKLSNEVSKAMRSDL